MDAGRFFSLAAITPLHQKEIERVCKICGSKAPIFDVVDFLKYCDGGEYPQPYRFGLSGIPVYYFRCDCCDFLFTDFFDGWSHDDFLTAIYNSDYVVVDPDYVAVRPQHMASAIANHLQELDNLSILDYGSGAGVFSSAIVERGYKNVINYDPFSNPNRPSGLFDVVTCFEVIEHSPQPLIVFEDIFSYLNSNGILIFTQALQPKNISEIRCNWWYVGPRNGHISTFSVRTLYEIGVRYGMALWELPQIGFAMARIGSNITTAIKAPCRKVEIEIVLQPVPENSHCWHETEPMPGGTFRWTSTKVIEWRIRLLSGVNKISIPYANQIREGYAEECRMLVNGEEVSLRIENKKIIGEITYESPKIVQAVLIQPALVSPVDHGRDDSRKLGLAIQLE